MQFSIFRLKKIYYVLSLISLISCGGGGGGGGGGGTGRTPTDPNTPFSTEKIFSAMRVDLSGYSTDGSIKDAPAYEAHVYQSVSGPVMISGVLATQVYVQLFISDDGFSTSNYFLKTSYSHSYDENGYLVHYYNYERGLNCWPLFLDKIPGTVKVGDSGGLAKLECNDTTTQETTWSVSDAYNEKIRLKIRTEYRSPTLFTYLTEVTYIIDSNGNIPEMQLYLVDLIARYQLFFESDSIVN